MDEYTYDDVRKAVESVKRTNDEFLREPKKRLQKLVEGELTLQNVQHAADALNDRLDEADERRRYQERLETETVEAVEDAWDSLDQLLDEAKEAGVRYLLDKLDEGARKRIEETLEKLKQSRVERPSLDKVFRQVQRAAYGTGRHGTQEDCKRHYESIIEERKAVQRGRPRKPEDEKKPTCDDVRKVIEAMERAEGRFPACDPVLDTVLKEAGGNRTVGHKHWRKIKEERELAAGSPHMELDKRIEELETKRKNALSDAKMFSEALKELKEERRQKLAAASRKTLHSSMRRPDRFGLVIVGNDDELRALEERIEVLQAGRVAALRLADALAKELRTLREDADA